MPTGMPGTNASGPSTAAKKKSYIGLKPELRRRPVKRRHGEVILEHDLPVKVVKRFFFVTGGELK
jgi:hypothetical protein